MIPLLILLLAAVPAAAQRSGCGMGLGLEAMRGAEAPLRAGATATSLLAGREAARQAAGQLAEASRHLAGCGCRQAAEHLGEAARLAEEGEGAAEVERIRRGLDRAGFSARLARERLDRQGCS